MKSEKLFNSYGSGKEKNTKQTKQNRKKTEKTQKKKRKNDLAAELGPTTPASETNRAVEKPV